MKTRSILPPAEPEFRDEIEAEFIARGLASAAEAKATGVYFDAEDVMRELDEILAQAKAKAAAPQK